MTKKEKELFKSLCSFKADTFDKNLLSAATPTVLGQLFFNRMQTVAYGVLKKHDLLKKVNREFRNSLKSAYEQNIEKNRSFFWCVQYLEDIFKNCSCKYAMLKGAYLCKAYPDGFRTSNDIDLLVRPKDVTELGNTLLSEGFIQGNIDDGKIKPATRREIIESKMMRGETVPYIKEINLPEMKFLEVDINFSLDYKPGNTELLDEMINNTVVEEFKGFKVRTLRKDDFFIHLCSHLYKEAATLPWVEMTRDMTMYKYADIYMLISDSDESEINFLFKRAKELGTEKICAFAIIQMSKLFKFGNSYAVSVAEEILNNDPKFIHTVISPKDGKLLIFTEKDIEKRFFAANRKSLLKEVGRVEIT